MLHSLYFYFRLVSSLVLLIPTMRRLGRVKERLPKDEWDKKVWNVAGNWAKDLLRDSGVKMQVEGLEHIPKDRTVLFVGNHQSNFDFLVLLGSLGVPTGFIAKIELEKIPLVSTWMKYLYCLFMDRSDMKQQMQTILAGIKELKEGDNLIVFPEGTRSKDGKMLEFKAGTFKLALKSKVPIVPFTIMGSADALENNHYMMKKVPIRLVIHPLIETKDIPKVEQGSLHRLVEEIVAKPFGQAQ